jgi:hypothetical protein
LFHFFTLPTVETVGYFQSPLPGLVDRNLAPPDFPPAEPG